MRFEASSARLLRQLAIVALASAALIAVAMNVFDDRRMDRTEMLERHHARVVSLVKRGTDTNRRLEVELRSLEEGVEGWREAARREHQMILEGEVIYRFPTEARRDQH